ncbi:MAG: FAD-dependent oxidoreductase [Clostridiaceae bacterium]
MNQDLNYDVVVIGGGPSGVSAAIAAGKNGARTLLVERFGYLGGMLTNAGTGPMMSFHAGETQVVQGIPGQIIDRMVENSFSPGHMKDVVGYCSSVTPFDAEGLKIIMEEMVMENNVDILYHTTFIEAELKDEKIVSLKLFSKGGFFNVTANVVVDASADADVAVSAGISTRYGRDKDNLAQPMTLNAKVYNVDREKLKTFMRDNVEDTNAKRLEVIDWSERTGISGFSKLIHEAIDKKELSYNRDSVLCFETNNKNEFIINMSRIARRSALNPFDLTKAEIEGRKQIRETVAFLRKYIPGFENCVLATTGPSIGIRESNKIDGVYILKEEELIANTMFDDAIAMGGYPIDIHSPEGKGVTNHQFLKEGSWYSIPYRCLVTSQVDNLIVVGRSLSATHGALAAVRVTPIAMAVGQAGGTAAAMASKAGVRTREIDTDLLRETLKVQGAFLKEYVQSGDDQAAGIVFES